MVVSEASATAFCNNDLLLVFCHFSEDFASLGISADAAQRDIENLVGSRASSTQVLTSVLTVFSKDMLGIFEVEQRPTLAVASQNDMSATTSVSAIRASLCVIFYSKEVGRTCSALARTDKDFDVVYKIGGPFYAFFLFVLV